MFDTNVCSVDEYSLKASGTLNVQFNAPFRFCNYCKMYTLHCMKQRAELS